MSKLDLGEYYHERFRDVLKGRYGETFERGFEEIEDRFKEVRSGDRDLTVEDVIAIFDPGLPFVRDWTKPDREDLAPRMDSREAAKSIHLLRDRAYDLELIAQIWRCFKELSLTALVLHHIYPKRFAMCSHHLASLLYITGPTVPRFYVNYCQELKLWSEREWPTKPKLTVANTEFGLWTWYRLTYFGKNEERKKHHRNFFEDSWVQERRAKKIADSLREIDTLDLARSYLDTKPTVAAIIAWREFATKVREILDSTGKATTKRDTIWDCIGRLPEESLPRKWSKIDLKSLWDRRNPVMHVGEEIDKDVAEGILVQVVEFIAHNTPAFRPQ